MFNSITFFVGDRIQKFPIEYMFFVLGALNRMDQCFCQIIYPMTAQNIHASQNVLRR